MVIRLGQRSPTGQWRQRLIDADCQERCVILSHSSQANFKMADDNEYHIGIVSELLHNRCSSFVLFEFSSRALHDIGTTVFPVKFNLYGVGHELYSGI